MGQRDPLHLRELAEVHYVFDRTMAPADLGRILFGSVLRAMGEKIGAIDEFGASQILPGDIPVAACQHAREGSVVTGIHHPYPGGLHTITEPDSWMIQIAG